MFKIDRTVCPSCSIGCGLNIIYEGNNVLGTYPYKRHMLNEGKACFSGRHSIDNLSYRINYPLILEGSKQVEEDFDKCIDFIVSEIKERKPEEVGVICSGKSTTEELETIKKFIEDNSFKPLIFTNNFMNFDNSVKSFEEVADADSLVLIGDILSDNPLLGRKIVQAKKNKANIYSVSNNKTITSINSSEAFYHDSISSFLENIDSEIKNNLTSSSIIIFNTIDSEENFNKILALADEYGCKILPVLKDCNSRGLLDIFESLTKEELLETIKDIKVLLVFNDDPLEYLNKEELEKIDTIILFSPFPNGVSSISKCIIPIKAWLENGGSFTNTIGQVQIFESLIDSDDSIYNESEIIEKISEKL